MKRVLFLAVVCTLLVNCSKDDDGNNKNCSKPQNLSIDQVNSTSAFFSWETGGESAFEIEYGERGFRLGEGTVRQTSQTEYLIDGLTPVTEYKIYLRSNCGSDGYSSYTSSVLVTLENTDACNTPTNLELVAVDSASIALTWDENNEIAWEVEYGVNGFPLGTGITIQTTQSNVEIVGLAPATTYEIYARASCGIDGFSSYSEQLVVTTDGL